MNERRRSWQDGTVRLRPRKSLPDMWELVYRRYLSSGGSEQATEPIGDKLEYPLEADVLGSKKLADLRTRINGQNGVESGVVFFRDLAHVYRETHVVNLSPKNQRGTINNMRYLEDQFGDWRLDKLIISFKEVQAWFDGDLRSRNKDRKNGTREEGETLARGTRKLIAGILSHMFNKGVDWRLVTHNPWGRLRVTKGPAPVERDFDIEDEMFWFLITDPETPRHVRMMIIIAGCTGLRIEEILALEWKNINFRRGRIMVTQAWVDGVLGPVKTDQAETNSSRAAVPMHPWLAEQLEAYRAEYLPIADWLFGSAKACYKGPNTGRNMPFWSANINREYLRPALHRMGRNFGEEIPFGTGFHAFRHTYITSLDHKGVTLKVTQALARHANPEMTLRYINKSRRFQDSMRQANYTLVDNLVRAGNAGPYRTGTDGD